MINKIKSKIQASIRSRKINVFLLFLVLSFSILLLTKLSKTYTNTFVFQLENINIPEDEVILNNSNSTLQITLKAYGFELLKYYLHKPKLELDFKSEVVKADSMYVWSKNKGFAGLNRQFNKNVELVNILPDSLWFRYDAHTIKMIPVVLNTNINFSPGYDLTNHFMLEPDSIKVIGPNILVSEINSIATDTVTLSNVKKDILKRVDLKLTGDLSDLKFSHSKVLLSAQVEKYTEGTLSIPVDLVNVPENITIKYFPKVVNVSYYTSLKNYKAITAKDFKVECDYSKLLDEETYLTPQVVKKNLLVRNVKINHQRIEFIITK